MTQGRNVTNKTNKNNIHCEKCKVRIANEIEYNCLWQEVSEFLRECKYKQLKNTTKSKPGELKTFNLNIRSLNKHISCLKVNNGTL